MERLQFYNIDDEYIEYLYQFDKKVPFNKNNKRPYIGIVLEINGITYFAPMFSPKQQHAKYKANATHINIDKNLGMIKLNNMIPVSKESLRLINFNKVKDKKYRNLLIQQNNFIQLNADKIRDMAEKLYKFVTVDKKPFFIQLCCDFKLLEEKSQKTISNEVEENKLIKDVEVTCEVFEETEKIIEVLENKGFHFVEEFTLDDIYMSNVTTKEFVPKNGRITDTLIIRYVNKNDQKIISKKRKYDDTGLEISTDKSILKIENIEDAERFLNTLGYNRFIRMIDKNYMYENDLYIAYIQEVQDLGTFLELEPKNKEENIHTLIEYLQELDMSIGNKFDVRKAELLYKKQKMEK